LHDERRHLVSSRTSGAAPARRRQDFHLQGRRDGRVLFYGLLIGKVQLTPAPLSPGEQLVWAAAFSAALARGVRRVLAARVASMSVDELRDLDGDELKDEEPEILAAVRQMRGRP